jgi:hypothetical protein
VGRGCWLLFQILKGQHRQCSIEEGETQISNMDTQFHDETESSFTSAYAARDGLMSASTDEMRVERRSRLVRVMVGILLAIALAFVVADSFGDRKIEKFSLSFLEWVEEHPYEGVLAVICVYIVATVLFVPGSILTLGTGYAFGSACDNTAYGVMLASTVCDQQCSSRISVFVSGSRLFASFLEYRLSSSGLP